ncbi:MAG TPA: hypothetical protein VND22_03235 [Actinomycetota bacterium]|nr:hypothetical protein [Actinomycetota bacterium]
MIGFLLLLSAAVPALMIRLIDSLIGKPFWPGRILAAVAAFSAPLTSHSGTLYPSVLGAVLVLVGSILFVEATKTERTRLLVVSAVPWALTGVFHHAYFLLSLGYLICLAVLFGRRIPKGVLVVYAVVHGGWLALSYVVGGDAMTGTLPGGIDLEYVLNQVSYHLFDQDHGLLTNTPVILLYLTSWPVVYWLRGRLPSFALKFLFVANSVTGLTLISYCFNGITPGESSISRYFVPVIPLAVLVVVYLGYHLLSWLVVSAGAVGVSAVIGAMSLVTSCRVTSCHPLVEEQVSAALGSFDPLRVAGNFKSWSLLMAYFSTLILSAFVPLVLLTRLFEPFLFVQKLVRAPASAD